MIIGSTALKFHFPEFRNPKDLDILAFDEADKEHLKKLKPEAEVLVNPILLNWCKEKYGFIPVYCPLEELYCLKVSHLFWQLENGSFSKHLWDVQFLKEKRCKLDKKLFYQLFNYWETIHGKRKTSDLSLNSKDFFTNAIDFPVEHDHLHKLLIKHQYFEGQKLPTYTKVLKDGAEVEVSEEKFNKLTEREKFNLVFEEICCMAIERFSGMYYKKAYNLMLTKFITSHTPVWEGIWIIENHKNLLTNIPFNFIEHLDKQIKNQLELV